MQSKFAFWIVDCGQNGAGWRDENERERQNERESGRERAALQKRTPFSRTDGGEKNNAENTLLSPNGMKLKLR